MKIKILTFALIVILFAISISKNGIKIHEHQIIIHMMNLL